jgi:hypothetical protein
MREDRCPAAVRGTADQPSRLADRVAFTKGVPLMRISSIESSVIPPRQGIGVSDTTTVLFDLENDPTQLTPIHDKAIEARLCAEIQRIMRAHDALCLQSISGQRGGVWK